MKKIEGWSPYDEDWKPESEDAAKFLEELKESDKDFYRILLQPPRRIGTGELLPTPKFDDETTAFIEKKKAELNVDDWPPKYRGWVPSDELVEEFMQFCRERRAKKYDVEL